MITSGCSPSWCTGWKGDHEAMKPPASNRRWSWPAVHDDPHAGDCRHVLCNQINRMIVNFVQSQGARRWGCTRSRASCSSLKTFFPGPTGGALTWSLGEVKQVNARLLQLLVQADSIPCIARSRATWPAGS